MLDKVIELADMLKGHAQNLNTAIVTQAELIKKVKSLIKITTIEKKKQ